MRRREFIIVLGTATVALPLPVRGQQPRPLLAILSPAAQNAQGYVDEPFKQALARLGWEPGRNIDIVERFADGDASRLPALAAELVSLKPHVLFTNTSYAAAAAAEATRTIPIVVGPAGAAVAVGRACPEATDQSTPVVRHWAWADLMRRAFDIDVLACPRCGGRLRLIATVEDPGAIRAILVAVAESGDLAGRAQTPSHPAAIGA